MEKHKSQLPKPHLPWHDWLWQAFARTYSLALESLTSSRRPRSFMDLPGELRNQIYGLIIQDTFRNDMHIGKYVRGPFWSESTGHSFTQVNRQISAEFLPFYQARFRLNFWVWDQHEKEHCLRWLDCFGDKRIPLATTIFVTGRYFNWCISFTNMTWIMDIETYSPYESKRGEVVQFLNDVVQRYVQRLEDGRPYITKDCLEYIIWHVHEAYGGPQDLLKRGPVMPTRLSRIP